MKNRIRLLFFQIW